MKLFGLTGGIYCGKSQTAKFFKEFGARLIDADQLAREAVLPGTTTLKEIEKQFKEILETNGELNRKALATIIFADPEKLEALNRIVQPAIRELFHAKSKSYRSDPKSKLIIYDAPLLLEQKFADAMDGVIVVFSEENQIRLRAENSRLGFEEIQKRSRSQIPIEEKIKQANFLIENNGTLEELKQKVEAFYRKLTE